MKHIITKTNEKVLKMIIVHKQPIKAEDLMSGNMNFKLRTIRYSLKTHSDSNLIERIPNLHDLRSFHYVPTNYGYSLLGSA